MEPITLPGKLRSIPQVIEYALEAGDRAKLGKRAQNRLRLAVEEFATNIITHGYQEAGLAGDIVIGADMDEKVLRITLEDTGEPFDPRQQPPPPDLDRPLDERSIGGMGIYLALQNVDEFDYEYTDGCNRNYIFIHRPPRTITRDLINSKTQQVSSLVSHYALNLERVKSHTTRVEELLAQIRADMEQQGIRLSNDIEAEVGRLHKRVNDVQEYSQRLLDQMNQFQKLLDISALISSSLEMHHVLESIMDTVIDLTGAGRAYLMLRPRNAPQSEFEIQAARDAEWHNVVPDSVIISQRIVEATVEQGKPIITIDARHDERFDSARSIMKNELRSVLSIPLVIQGDYIGLLYMDNSTREGVFSEELIPLLTIFATQAATAIENARLFETMRNDVKMERDLQIGKEIQASFLPTSIPRIEGWDISAYFHPARQVAGDFYDVFLISHDKIGFVVGDVCDKGVGAAMFMALVRSLTRAFAQQHHSLSWMDDMVGSSSGNRQTTAAERRILLSAGAVALKNAIVLTNDYVAINHGESNMFATMFFGMIDPTSGTLTYVNGGHNPPMLIAPDGRIKEQLTLTGPAVGMMPEMDFGLSQTRLERGDTLLCYTDGLTEAHSKSGDFFGENRVTEIIQAQAGRSAGELVETLHVSVFDHMKNAAQFDDITILALQRS